MILQAQFVVEEDAERVAQQERQQIKEETRQEIMGERAQAKVVEDDGSQTRCRRCCWGLFLEVCTLWGREIRVQINVSSNSDTYLPYPLFPRRLRQARYQHSLR
jgi:hypothetical protein